MSEPIRVGPWTFDVAGVSEQGPRPENQDAFTVGLDSVGIVAVADGMGGERSGRLAADTALEALIAGGPIRSLDEARHAVRRADAAVSRSADAVPGERGGMGCALALLSLAPGRNGDTGWVGAHVGDVRIVSRSPDGAVRLETRDHTPAFARWEAGEIALDEIPEAEGSNRLQRAVGRGGEADVVWIPLRAGWSYLLASDGISKATRLEELGEAMAAPTSVAACEQIRRKVLERGPDDNFTAVVVRVLGGERVSSDEHTLPNPGPLMPQTQTQQPRRTSGSVLPLLLALLALVAAGAALWLAWDARAEGARFTRLDGELARLRSQVDSLEARAVIPDTLAADSLGPFGPTATTQPSTTRP